MPWAWEPATAPKCNNIIFLLLTSTTGDLIWKCDRGCSCSPSSVYTLLCVYKRSLRREFPFLARAEPHYGCVSVACVFTGGSPRGYIIGLLKGPCCCLNEQEGTEERQAGCVGSWGNGKGEREAKWRELRRLWKGGGDRPGDWQTRVGNE